MQRLGDELNESDDNNDQPSGLKCRSRISITMVEIYTDLFAYHSFVSVLFRQKINDLRHESILRQNTAEEDNHCALDQPRPCKNVRYDILQYNPASTLSISKGVRERSDQTKQRSIEWISTFDESRPFLARINQSLGSSRTKVQDATTKCR